MKQQRQNNTSGQLTFRGDAGGVEIGALACDALLLAIFLWNQLRYGMDMLFLILPLFMIGVYLTIFGVIPETYRFSGSGLEIMRPLRKTACIPYDAVFNFDAAIHDNFINLLHENKVKVYHMDGRVKRVTVCKPKDAGSFVEILKLSCPELHTDTTSDHRLDVFFENQDHKS